MSVLRRGAQIWRYEVPVDDQWHMLSVAGDILHIDGRRLDLVVFWAQSPGPDGARNRTFRVIGTGHPIPEESTYRGTAVIGGLVWHLIELGGTA